MVIKLAVPLLVFAAALVAGCSDVGSDGAVNSESRVDGRWYSTDQVALGDEVFQGQCAVCHGARAQGLTEDWRQRLDDGSFPPPPLNGSAHAWHHPLSVLTQVINEGGVPLGGKMPAFADVLSDAEKLAAVAYLQSFWDDEIYANWEQMGGTN